MTDPDRLHRLLDDAIGACSSLPTTEDWQRGLVIIESYLVGFSALLGPLRLPQYAREPEQSAPAADRCAASPDASPPAPPPSPAAPPALLSPVLIDDNGQLYRVDRMLGYPVKVERGTAP